MVASTIATSREVGKQKKKKCIVIYLPIVARAIHDLTLCIVDQNDRPIDFRGEEITIRLHVQRRPRDSLARV